MAVGQQSKADPTMACACVCAAGVRLALSTLLDSCTNISALEHLACLQLYSNPIVTELVPAATWYDAEKYHQVSV